MEGSFETYALGLEVNELLGDWAQLEMKFI